MSAVSAVDPIARTVLTIPNEFIVPTLGYADFQQQKSKGRDMSICCLYQRGKCRADNQCRQLHVDRQFVAKARTQQPVETCCTACQDEIAAATDAVQVIRLVGKAAASMPLLATSRVIPTQFQLDAPVNGVLSIEWSAVCRLQLQDTCKYGRMCRNVHLCAKLGSGLLARAATSVNAVVPDSVRETAERLNAFAVKLAVPEVGPTVKPATAAAAPQPTPQPTPQPAVATTTTTAEAVVVAEPRPPKLRFERANICRLDEGSLTLQNADLDGLVFHLPTLASASSMHSDRFDLFSPSPFATLARRMCNGSSPTTVS